MPQNRRLPTTPLPTTPATVVALALVMSLAACSSDHENHHHIPPEVEAAANADTSLHSFALSGDFPGSNWVKSPNYSTSWRGKGKITTIVVHTIQGSYNGCISWFSQTKSKVSAHYVISKTGKITQMVKDKDVAWHVGSQNG